MIYTYTIEGVPLRTGDIICTANGAVTEGVMNKVAGTLYHALGMVVPGEVDHIAMYIGPGGRCVEAGARGVITFDVYDGRWDAQRMHAKRWLLDTFYGIAYPLHERGLSANKEAAIREDVARFCLEQATTARPYNVNFFNPGSEAAFYCSQLAYRAYIRHGIDLDQNRGHLLIEHIGQIVFPYEIWHSCANQRVANAPEPMGQLRAIQAPA
jgi:uncharacterized protein YycO